MAIIETDGNVYSPIAFADIEAGQTEYTAPDNCVQITTSY